MTATHDGCPVAGHVEPAGGAALKLAVIGPGHLVTTDAAAHTTTLAHHLARAGHDVTLVTWSSSLPGRRAHGEPVDALSAGVPAFPRTVRALSWARPGTWVRTGRRLRGFDAIIVMDPTPALVPAHLAILRAAGSGGFGVHPRTILIAQGSLPRRHRLGDFALIASLFERVDAVLVHSPEQAPLAVDLHAARVSVADAQGLQGWPRAGEDPDLSSPWAHYVGAMEALASPPWTVEQQAPPATSTRPWFRMRLAAAGSQVLRRQRPALAMTRADLPAWVRPSDVLADGADAEHARDWARSYGLPRCADPIAAWAALGALAAIVRLSDDGHRSAVILDGSGSRSPMSRWARSIGFAPVELDLTASPDSLASSDVDTCSLDVIARLHPNGCDSKDIDQALGRAARALRPGGLISLTLPLGPASAEGAVGPADVRALLARAASLGFVLVGDPDGQITTLMRAASEGPGRADAAYGLVRLTFRRR